MNKEEIKVLFPDIVLKERIDKAIEILIIKQNSLK